MAGIRKKEFYVEEYGENIGNIKYSSLLASRRRRKNKENANRSLANQINQKLKKWTLKEKEENVKNGNLIKCLECGKYLTRLQWTHFKYKCTGRFNNGSEYQKTYPDGAVVSPNLSKLTSMTKEAMVSLYGENDGLIKWQKYCDKQSETNTFEYKFKKYGYTELEFDEFNKSRAVTITNLIKKYGECIGIEKWNNYCERQRYTCTIEYFIEKHGEINGRAIFNNWSKNRSGHLSGPTSGLEKEVYNNLQVIIPELEYQIMLINQRRLGAFDMGSNKHKKIIEFNGDYWHANPAIYESGDYINYPFGLKLVNDIWDKDILKNKMANELGYDVFVVWERSWKENKLKMKKDILEWWNNETIQNT